MKQPTQTIYENGLITVIITTTLEAARVPEFVKAIEPIVHRHEGTATVSLGSTYPPTATKRSKP